MSAPELFARRTTSCFFAVLLLFCVVASGRGASQLFALEAERPPLAGAMQAGSVIDTLGQDTGAAAAGAGEEASVRPEAGGEQPALAQILTGIALAIAATVLFLALLRLLRWMRRVALERLRRENERPMRVVAVRGFTLFDADEILALLRRGVDLVAWSLGLFTAYLWLTFVLTRFPYSRPWGEALGVYLVTTLRDLTLGALSAVPGLFTVVIIFFAARFVARLLGTFFTALEVGEASVPWVHPETAQPTRRIVIALLWLFAVIVAYPYLPGSGSDVFKGVTVLVGLVLSLGSSGLVNQAMSGLVLMYARALKPGEYVRVADVEGTVSELTLLSTKIRTNKMEEVTIPNAVVVGTTTKNYSRMAEGEGLILHTSVTIGYDTPWRQVHALLIEAAQRTRGLQHQPAAFVRQTALSDFYVEYQLNAYLGQPSARLAVLSDLHANIQDCFNEHGVQIMSPHYESDPATPKLVPRNRWHAPPADSVSPGLSARSHSPDGA